MCIALRNHKNGLVFRFFSLTGQYDSDTTAAPLMPSKSKNRKIVQTFRLRPAVVKLLGRAARLHGKSKTSVVEASIVAFAPKIHRKAA